MTQSNIIYVCAIAMLAGCADPEGGLDSEPRRILGTELIEEGSPEAIGVLAFLNARDTTAAFLDDDVGLYKRPAQNIAAHIRGPDGAWGTADDDRLDSITELDDVSRVGPRSIEKILGYVESIGGVPGIVVEGVRLTDAQAALILDAANTASLLVLDEIVDLDSRAARNIIAARPIGDMEALAAVPYVGKAAITRLLRYALDPPPDPDVNRQSYVVDGVEMTVPQANGLVGIANRASFQQLDDEAGLDARAARNIIAARPIPTIERLGAVRYVGASALRKLLDYLPRWNGVETVEIGVISDLDKTIIPPHRDVLPDAAYPGVATLLTELEFGNDGKGGDLRFVTARSPDRIQGIAQWLLEQGVPPGPIETGISGLPWVAQPEKVADISAILDAHPDQRFLLFGDTSHRDPEVFREVIPLFPNQIAGAYVHRVNNVSPSRVTGLTVYNNYAELASLLLRAGELDRNAARRVMLAAQSEGLEISDAEIEALLR
jgi:DNA uptake protein ComE-like DNA-binding protein